MMVQLKNEFDIYKEAKVGVSWTTLFFGCLTPLVRQDFLWVGIMLVVNYFTWGLGRWFFMFAYNKFYVESLLEKGFKPANQHSQDILKMSGFMFETVEFEQKKRRDQLRSLFYSPNKLVNISFSFSGR